MSSFSIERNLPQDSVHHKTILFFKQVLAQTRSSKHKIYALHEPDTLCISKGKEHKKYEFGSKVSLVKTQNTGVIVGAMGFRNEFDGHTLIPALEQVNRLVGKGPRTATVDRGYRGNTKIGSTRIPIPKPFNDKKQTKYQQKKLRIAHLKRAAIEPVIGHLKTDHRLGRNFYKGIVGDNINIMLATAFNFKRMMNKWKTSFFVFIQNLFFQFNMWISNWMMCLEVTF